MTADSAKSASDALHARVREVIAAFEGGREMPESFDALAADLAVFQADHVPGYGRLCAARGVDPRAITRAAEAPAVPAEAFKLARVFAFDDRDAAVTFRTSGTSRGARGVHSMRSTASYDAAALAFGAAMFGRAGSGAGADAGAGAGAGLGAGLGAPLEFRSGVTRGGIDAGAMTVIVVAPSDVEAPDSSL